MNENGYTPLELAEKLSQSGGKPAGFYERVDAAFRLKEARNNYSP